MSNTPKITKCPPMPAYRPADMNDCNAQPTAEMGGGTRPKGEESPGQPSYDTPWARPQRV